MSDTPVLFEIKGKIALITLNRPGNRNSMDGETMPAFRRALDMVRDNKDLRCLIITGSGDTFCAGADFKSDLATAGGNRLPNEALMDIYGPFLSIHEFEIPTIAAMNGHAVGGGFGLALICDIRIAGIDSKYGANFGRLGIHSGMAISYMLPRIVGLPLANELLLTGRLISGQKAAEIGLANYALKNDHVMKKAWEIAGEI